MGDEYEATCRDCSQVFRASEGGGFLFSLPHCRACGQAKSVAHDLVADAKEQYYQTAGEVLEAAGLTWETLVAVAAKINPDAQRRFVDALLEAEHRFNEAVEAAIGRCSCGGQFGLHAPVRCPVCRSTNVIKGPTSLTYD